MDLLITEITNGELRRVQVEGKAKTRRRSCAGPEECCRSYTISTGLAISGIDLPFEEPQTVQPRKIKRP
jgi:hypothetical protein